MLFKNMTSKVLSAYGYTWKPGEFQDVTEENLINKFKLYNTLETIEQSSNELEAETLQSQAIAMGLKVDGRWSEKRLRKEVERYGNARSISN